MRSELRSRLTFANVGVVIAIFFALGGPSFAANAVSHAARLITGKQIKDNSITTKDVKNGSLLSKDFRAGQLPAGPQGSQGPQGPRGEQGIQGDAGPFPGVLPRGKTIRGVYGVATKGDVVPFAKGAYSFGFKLASAPQVHFIPNTGNPDPADCPGSDGAPEAAAGHLCVYEHTRLCATNQQIANPETNAAPASSAEGFLFTASFDSSSCTVSTTVRDEGSWAVGSP